MIFGGFDKNSNNLGDVIVFDTKTKQCTKVISEGASEFYAPCNVQASNDKVIGLIYNNRGIAVYSWEKGASAITVVKEYEYDDNSDEEGMEWQESKSARTD